MKLRTETISPAPSWSYGFQRRIWTRRRLYTIQAEPPGFLVPFRYRSIDGQAECTYQLGGRSKLQYRYGSREPEEYITFWQQVLTPILECSDWFLKPLSFVLDARYLYWGRSGKGRSAISMSRRIPIVQRRIPFGKWRGAFAAEFRHRSGFGK